MNAQRFLLLTELKLLLRYRIVLAAVAAIAGYIAVFGLAGRYFTASASAFLIYTDPAVLGLAFAGLLTMLEREEGVARQMAVSPVGPLSRLFWRVSVLSLPALGAASIFALLFTGIVDWAAFVIAILSTSVTYCAIGAMLARQVRRVTAFIALCGAVVMPISASALLAFSGAPAASFWPFASQLAVLSASLTPGAEAPTASLVICIAVTGLTLLGASHLTARGDPS
jgi:hypothetical protein